MPASKRMIQGGGDLPRNPALLKKKSSDAAEAPQEPAQLELVTEPPAAPVPAPEPAQAADGIVITIKSNNLKESKGKGRDGKPPVYRSITGKDAGGKTYWLAIEMEDANPQKGDQYIVKGKERKPFGNEKNPLYPIDVTSIKPYEAAVADISESAKVSSTSADSLVQTMAALVGEHGNYTVLKALAEAIK